MKLGKINLLLIVFLFIFHTNLIADDKILSAPVINLENLEPSYEVLEKENNTSSELNVGIKKRNIIDKKKSDIKFVNLIGLDKITAKTFQLR